MALRARGCMVRKEFPGARKILEEGLGWFPQEPWLLEILRHALLQEGKDLAAAEQVLRKLLELEPNNGQARNNLGVLLRDQRRNPEGI